MRTNLIESLKSLAPWIVAAVIGAALVAVLDPVRPVAAWGYLALLVPGSVALWAAWRWVAGDGAPRWLPAAIAAAVLLRLGFAVFFARALPVHGYPDSDPHQDGYFYQDAHLRDGDAWELAVTTSRPLTVAFTDRGGSDQYGGLLFMSALIYRTLSLEVHHPLLAIVPGAVTGGLAVLFTWAFVAGAFGRTAASIAGWGMAVYPEAVFIGASQMREPFLIAALAACLYGYLQFKRGNQRSALAIILLAALLIAPISPPYTLLVAGVVGGALLWERGLRALRLLLLAGVIGVLALVMTAGAWGNIDQAPQGSLLELVDWWLVSGARFELVRLERGSGFVQRLFETAPEWAHLPMATGYGLVQPFLPATILDSTSLPLPRILAVLRGLGWFVALPFLIYVPVAAIRAAGWRSLVFYLSGLVWLLAILASYRLAGDLWDNPRARAVFVPIQLSLVGWGWVRSRQSGSPWLARVIWLVAGSTLIFMQWYAGRYYQTPRLNLNQTVLTVAVYVIGLLGGALLWDLIRKRRLTTQPPKV